jgi:uncharacterized membrane protein YdjX (TVP38/TMEM64 family)
MPAATRDHATDDRATPRPDVTAAPDRRKAKIAAVLAVVVLLLVAHQLGLFRQFADPAGVKQALVGLGPWGYLAFIAAYATLQPFGFPGSVFIWGAPLIWPWPVAFALSLTGTMAASVVGFLFARFIARDWVSARIPARFRRYDDALGRRAFATVFLLRLVFWMAPPLHAFFGVSSVRFSTHFWGSLAGYVLPMLLVSIFGERVFEVAVAAPLELWIGLGVGVATIGLGVWALRRRRPVAPTTGGPSAVAQTDATAE